MANVDLNSRYASYQKGKRLGLSLIISFGSLDVLSIILFIVFSNWRQQLFFSILGSVICSLLGIMTLFFALSIYLPNNEMAHFYGDLLRYEENKSIETIESLSLEKQTQRRGISCFCVITAEHEYCLLPEENVSLKEHGTYELISRGKYIVEAKEHEV